MSIITTSSSQVEIANHISNHLVECVLDGSVSLLQSGEADIGVLRLSVEITSNQFPVTLVIQAEPRDKHGNRPSTHAVLLRGTRFEFKSAGVYQITV